MTQINFEIYFSSNDVLVSIEFNLTTEFFFVKWKV